MINIKKHLIGSSESLTTALSKLNPLTYTILFVVNEHKKLVGTLTDGDIRRGLINGLEKENSVDQFMNTEFKYFTKSNISGDLIKQYQSKHLKLIPVLDESHKIDSIINLAEVKSWLPLTAVIMAGGVGSRLRPLTENTPKPLLKIGGKPIIEYNIDRLIQFGVQEIYISIRYLGQQLIDYFGDGSAKGIKIKYLTEDTPLGTIGAISKIDELHHEHLLVMNSDLLTDIDFDAFFNRYTADNSDLCVATIPYEVKIPYAIMESEGSKVLSLQEKPTYTYYSNAGIYIMKKWVQQQVERNVKVDATDLMEHLIETNKNLTHYGVHGYWLDIGKHNDFEKAQEDIKHLNL